MKRKRLKFAKPERRKKTESQTLKKECDDLRRKIIYKRAGYKSELSGISGYQIGGEHILDDHHLVGKPNYRLRYELSNGICLTKGEHFFIAHNPGEAEKFRRWVLNKKGSDFFDRMDLLKNAKSEDLRLVKTYLENELKKLEGKP